MNWTKSSKPSRKLSKKGVALNQTALFRKHSLTSLGVDMQIRPTSLAPYSSPTKQIRPGDVRESLFPTRMIKRSKAFVSNFGAEQETNASRVASDRQRASLIQNECVVHRGKLANPCEYPNVPKLQPGTPHSDLSKSHHESSKIGIKSRSLSHPLTSSIYHDVEISSQPRLFQDGPAAPVSTAQTIKSPTHEGKTEECWDNDMIVSKQSRFKNSVPLEIPARSQQSSYNSSKTSKRSRFNRSTPVKVSQALGDTPLFISAFLSSPEKDVEGMEISGSKLSPDHNISSAQSSLKDRNLILDEDQFKPWQEPHSSSSVVVENKKDWKEELHELEANVQTLIQRSFERMRMIIEVQQQDSKILSEKKENPASSNRPPPSLESTPKVLPHSDLPIQPFNDHIACYDEAIPDSQSLYQNSSDILIIVPESPQNAPCLFPLCPDPSSNISRIQQMESQLQTNDSVTLLPSSPLQEVDDFDLGPSFFT